MSLPFLHFNPVAVCHKTKPAKRGQEGDQIGKCNGGLAAVHGQPTTLQQNSWRVRPGMSATTKNQQKPPNKPIGNQKVVGLASNRFRELRSIGRRLILKQEPARVAKPIRGNGSEILRSTSIQKQTWLARGHHILIFWVGKLIMPHHYPVQKAHTANNWNTQSILRTIRSTGYKRWVVKIEERGEAIPQETVGLPKSQGMLSKANLPTPLLHILMRILLPWYRPSRYRR